MGTEHNTFILNTLYELYNQGLCVLCVCVCLREAWEYYYFHDQSIKVNEMLYNSEKWPHNSSELIVTTSNDLFFPDRHD